MRVIAILFSLAVAGCASQADIDSWQGATFGELVANYGAPSATTNLSNGERLVEFSHYRNAPVSSYNDSVGTHVTGGGTYQCKLWFIIGSDNRVKSGKAKGNIGGCNRLIEARN
ncbi:hypothetical protein [Microbulbifer discodermiae]|uniref:hypothetical protein n=1 Tax=Microbulbifer sp. 2201CG32-9 TaxID=3232309 RepID=UPI00345B7CBF